VKNANHGQKQELDLFGNPIVPLRDRRGRPSFVKSKENQDFVSVRSAASWSHDRIAEEIGCDAKTLRKYFSRELAFGSVIIEGMALDVLMKRSREGHVPSIRLLRDYVNPAIPAAPKKGKGKLVTPLGKKQLLSRDAETPPDGWGGLLPDYGKAN